MATKNKATDSPQAEDLDLELPEDVMDLVDEGHIGHAEEYGFSCEEEMIDDVLGRQGYDGILDHKGLEEHQAQIDQVLERDYRHAQAGWYNPENGDAYLMDVEDL